MNACIYARTSRIEKGENITSIPNQLDFCKALAQRHNLNVLEFNIYTDVEIQGSFMPSCWAGDDEEVRPALSAMIEAIEREEVSRVIVRRMEKLGTSSDVLIRLLELFKQYDIKVITETQTNNYDADPRGEFATSILRPVIQFDTEAEEEKKSKIKAKKLEELERLKAKVARLEAEISEM
ncbi:hypothetical protein BVX94_02185 [bacterium B17]|nr:hypothetical protein BVX94_02185 [bacterium B17]